MFSVEIKSERDEDVCLLINVQNHSYNYICDCGEAKALSAKECRNTKAIFLSHTHIDHFINFDKLLRHQIGTERKIIICGPEGITDQIQHRIKSYCWNLIEAGAVTYEIREVKDTSKYNVTNLNPPLWEKEEVGVYEQESIFTEKDFCVEFEVLDHKTSSIAYLFRAEDKLKINLKEGFKGGKWINELKSAFEQHDENKTIKIEEKEYLAKDLFSMVSIVQGKKLGVIMDHAASHDNHIKIKNKFTHCDDVYIECFYKNEDKELADKNYHSYAAMSGSIMKECNVKNAIPVHYSRKYDATELDELITQFDKAYKL